MVLKAHDPCGDWDSQPELKRQVARTLMALADTGVTTRKSFVTSALI